MKYLYLLFLFACLQSCTHKLIKFQVDSETFDRIDCPLALPIPKDVLDLSSKDFQLIELLNNSKKIIPSQFDKEKNQLLFILDGYTPKNTIRKYALINTSKEEGNEQIEIKRKDGALQFTFNKNPILNYQFEMTFPPEGIDEKYKKSGFIHPLWSPSGDVLTRINPPDHYHHYGIWGPWTKTIIEEREVDFWNLAKGQGTVLFKKFLNESQGDVFSGFTALQEHIDFGATEENKVAINEALEIKIWNTGTSKKTWLIDYTTTIKSPLKSGVLLDAYRYGGGIGFRATEKWHKDNTTVLTSENKNRLTADGSYAKWVIIEGETKNGRSGILFMSFPDNRKFPEPMRVWPIDANKGRGDMFFEFCPIRNTSWKIENNKEYVLKYRMVIFDDNIKPENAEIYWNSFANPPTITIN